SRMPEAVMGSGKAEPTSRTPLSSKRSNEPIETLASVNGRAMLAGIKVMGGPAWGLPGAAATAAAGVWAGGFALPAQARIPTTDSGIHLAPRPERLIPVASFMARSSTRRQGPTLAIFPGGVAAQRPPCYRREQCHRRRTQV